MRRSLTGLIVALALVSSWGCPKDVKIPPAPTVITTIDTDVKAGAIKALGILESAGHVANKAEPMAMNAAKAFGASQAVQDSIRDGFHKTSVGALAAIDTIEKGAVTDWPKLKAILDPVLGSVESLVNIVNKFGSGGASASDWLSVLFNIVKSAVAIIPKSPVPAGAF